MELSQNLLVLECEMYLISKAKVCDTSYEEKQKNLVTKLLNKVKSTKKVKKIEANLAGLQNRIHNQNNI